MKDFVYGIPVSFLGILVFLLLCCGCGGSREVLELKQEVSGEAADGGPAGEGSGNAESGNIGPGNTEAGSTGVNSAGVSNAEANGTGVNGTGSGNTEANSAGAGSTGADPAAAESVVLQELVVHVCGAVNAPGVYRLPAGSRVCDAVEAAGGLNGEAAESSVNQASMLEDGMQIVIPTAEEAAGMPVQGILGGSSGNGSGGGNSSGGNGSSGSTAGGGSGAGLVNINTADLTELMTLPGIGQTRAEAIVAFRQENGNFSSIEDIMKVDGIKEGSFAKLKDKITVR